jgi:hypothetical protein
MALSRTAIAAMAVLFLSGCSDFNLAEFLMMDSGGATAAKPAKVELPPAPKPIYAPGDTFVYNDQGNLVQEQVVSVSPDRVVWTNDAGLIWTSGPDLVTPALSWSSDPELGRGRQIVIGDPSQLFPLQEGKQVAFGVRGNSENVPTGWQDENRCVVSGQEDITVPAGTFTTFRIDCQRRDYVASIYYAPVVQNYVLRARKFEKGESRKELVSVSLASDRTKDMPATAEKDKAMSDAGAKTMADTDHSSAKTPMKPAPSGHGAAKPTMAPSGMASSGDDRMIMLLARLERVISKLEALGTAPPAMPAKPEMKTDSQAKPPKKMNTGGKYGVHLASYRTTKGARRGWQTMARRFPALKELSFQTSEFDAGDGKGTYVRLLAVSFKTKKSAANFCKDLKKKRQFCAPMRVVP